MNKKIHAFKLLVCFLIFFVPSQLMAAVTIQNVVVDFSDNTVASETDVFVTFDLTAGTFNPTDRFVLELPFGWDLGPSNLGFNNTPVNFSYTIDFENHKIILDGDGSNSIATAATYTISIQKVFVQKSPVPIGNFSWAAYTSAWGFLDEDFVLGSTLSLIEGDHVMVHPFTRDGAILQTGQDFEIKFGIFDQGGNHDKSATITSPSFTPLGGTGNLSVINTSVSNGIMTATLRYDKEEKIAIDFSGTINANTEQGFLGQFYFVHNTVPPAAPGTPMVCAAGVDRDSFILQWMASPTPGVTYELWQHYSTTQILPQFLSPGSAHNNDFAYAEYRATEGTSYHRYFPTFTKAYGGINQWRKVLDSVPWDYTGFVPYSPVFLGDYMNYSEFTLGHDYSMGPVDETFSDDWFRHPYGAFRVVAKDPVAGTRSLSSAEMVRAPWAQDLVFDPQHLIHTPPQNVICFYEGTGNIRVIWDQPQFGPGPPAGMGSGQIFKWYVYRKVVNSSVGIFDEEQEYSYFTFVAETNSPDFVFPINESYPSFHEYSSLTTQEPYGIFKIVGVSDTEWLTSTSAESRTVKYMIDPGFGSISLDIVNYPPTPVTTDQAIDFKFNLVDDLNQVIFDDNSSTLNVNMFGMSAPMTFTAQNGVIDVTGLRQYVTGNHTINCQLNGQVGPGTNVQFPIQVTADATRIVVVFDEVEKLVVGQNPMIAPTGGGPNSTSDYTLNIPETVNLYAVDNYNNIDPNFSGTIDSVGFGHNTITFGPQGTVQNITMSGGEASATLSADFVFTRGLVSIDTTTLYNSKNVTGNDSSYMRSIQGVRVVFVTFDDINNDGKTDSVIVSFDTPLKDATVGFTDNTTPPFVRGWNLQRPGETGTEVKPDGWHSEGPLDDTQIRLIFDQFPSDGTIMKDLIYHQRIGDGLKGVNGGHVYNLTTWDNASTAIVGKHNNQSSIVTSASAYAYNGSNHITSVTLDFSGPIPSELADPNRWFVIASDGVVLNNTGVIIDNATNKLTVLHDGLIGDNGQPDIGLVEFDFNFIPQGLIAIPGQTSAGAAQIDLFWNPINDPNFQEFLVFRSTTATGPWSLLTETTQTLTSDAAIATGTTYYYHLRSFGNGNLLSLPSSTVFAVVQGSPPTATAAATPTSGTAPLQISFTGTGTDVDGTIVAYDWDFNIADQIAVDHSSPTSPNTIYTYNEPGTFTARLTVHDNHGNTDTADVQITVSAPPSGPTANATLSTTGGPAPLTVTFSDTSTAGSFPIALWQWDFDGDGNFDKSSTLTGDAVFVYRIPNQTYSSVKLRVTDTDNKSNVKTFSITVGNATNPPLVTIDSAQATGADGIPLTPVGALPYCVTFDVATYDGAGGNIVKWEWDFDGDGLLDRITTRDDGVVTYCYVAPGNYSAQVRVTDTDGLLAFDSEFVQVSTPTNVNIFLVEPVTLDKVGGDQIPLVALTVPNSLTSTVVFEASTNTTSWTQIGTTQTGVKFEYFQALSLAGYGNGPIYLRARCTDVNAGSDTSPTIKVIKVPDQAAEVIENIANGQTTKEVSFDTTETQDIKSSIGAGIFIPLGAISDDAAGIGGLRCVIAEKGSGGPGFSDLDGLPQSGGAQTIENLGKTIAFDINLGNGGEVNVPDKPLTITIPYPDENNDGIVDGTSKSETDLEIWYYDDVSGTWKRTINTVIDTENNTLTVTIAHLTDFGMFATVVSSALGGGAGVPGGATAGVGLCLVSTPAQIAVWTIWLLGLLTAGWLVSRRFKKN